jgi:NitT/TauT family transport system ATP-binding protein
MEATTATDKKVEFINTDLPDLIELKEVSQVYTNEDGSQKTVLKGVNLLIEDKPNVGQFVTLLGESGCGKSTILRYISGLQTPTAGEIKIKGKLLTKEDRVGMIFQQYSSFPWRTVLDNVAFGLELKGVPKEEREERAMKMIQIVGLKGHEKKFAKYPTLSGGQLQRVAIARSLLSNPEMLVMDEPFGALDIRTRLQMQDMLLEIWSQVQATIILVTHDISEAVYLSDDIYIMSVNPGTIKHHVKVPFSYPRNKDIKRLPSFVETVQQVEQLMMQS